MISKVLFHLRAAGLCVLLALAPALAEPAAAAPKVTVVSFGLFGNQSVFESEAKGAARILTDRLHATSTVVRYNTKKGGDATAENLYATLQSSAKSMDVDNDVLAVVLTTHGAPAGLAVISGSLRELLAPPLLAGMLNATKVQHRIVIISACYSGVFIPFLASPDTLVITAADANHPSFGCQDRATWTYFGDAFFNTALRKTGNLSEAFAMAQKLVRQRELKNGFEPSNPQMGGGENIVPMLQPSPPANGARTDPPAPPDVAHLPVR
jgi:hypothetical protein